MIMTENLENFESISEILANLTPGKRLKYIRQKIVNKNQMDFCIDGIVRSGTLKSIESERIQVGSKVAEKICHKLSLEGIECSPDIFMQNDDPCLITVNKTNKEIIGSSLSRLEEIKTKTHLLTPVEVTDDNFSPYITKGSTLMVQELSPENLTQLNNCLCFIKGNTAGLYFLSYENDEKIHAKTPCSESLFTKAILEFCKVYQVEIIYLQQNNTKIL